MLELPALHPLEAGATSVVGALTTLAMLQWSTVTAFSDGTITEYLIDYT